MNVPLLTSALVALVTSVDVETGESPCRPLDLEGATEEQLPLLEAYRTEETRSGAAFPWTLERTFDGEAYDRYALSFPSAFDSGVEVNDEVRGHYWRPEGREGPGPAAVVLHWKGGYVELLDLLCARLAEEGLATVMIYLPHYGPRRESSLGTRARMIVADLDATLANHRQAVLDVRRAADWLADREEVDAGRIGLVGISLGAVVGGLAAGVDGGFHRTVLVLGGADVPAIVMNPSRETRSVRRAAIEAGYSVDDLREAWRPAEPITFASRIRADSVLMINTEEDAVIPREATVAFQEAIGVEEVVWYPGGHHALLWRLRETIDRTSAHLLVE